MPVRRDDVVRRQLPTDHEWSFLGWIAGDDGHLCPRRQCGRGRSPRYFCGWQHDVRTCCRRGRRVGIEDVLGDLPGTIRLFLPDGDVLPLLGSDLIRARRIADVTAAADLGLVRDELKREPRRRKHLLEGGLDCGLTLYD